MLSVSLGSLNDIQLPGGKSVLVPLTGTDSLGGPITYSSSSSDPTVETSLVSTASKSLELNVTGTDSSNNSYSGTLILHLFEDLVPETTARIEQLVNQGYYNDLVFHRVLDGFVAQTGETNNGNDTGVLLDDEFNTSLTYTSPGLLAMASRGPDTADAEFFITAIDGAGTTNPITLADMPQSLDFRYTIFGQLVSGFDTFEKIMSTPVTTNPDTGEDSQPTNSITITSASLLDDTQDAVLRVFAPASFDGHSASVTVTATNADNETAQQTFSAAAITDANVDPPFLGPVTNQATAAGAPVSFTLTSTDLSAGGVTYLVVDPNTLSTPANVTENIDQSTGEVTLTPNAGFIGTIHLLATVRPLSNSSEYDSQAFALDVEAPSLDSVADQTTAAGLVDTLTLTAHDALGDGVVYKVVDAATLAAPANADVSIDQATGEVALTPHAGFSGTLNLLAEVRDANSPDDSANYTTQAFQWSVVVTTLGTVSNQTTTVATPVNFNLTSTDPLGAGVVYSIVDPTTLTAPAHVTVDIDQVTGAVTLTPDAGFGGFVPLQARVRLSGSPDVAANYVTQNFMLTVNSVVTINPIDDVDVPAGKSVLVPLAGVDSAVQPLTYTFSSSDPNVQLSIVSPASKSLVLNVTGTDSNNSPFTGALVLHLFEDLAPETTARIEQLVSDGYYNDLIFHRVIDGFMAQTGQTNGGNDTGVLLEDEFNTALTFTSPGLLATANRGRDTADAEFFITAIDGAGTTNPITLADMPQSLDFRYTIFGQLVSGFDTFEKIMSASVTQNVQTGETSQPVDAITITSATLINDTKNGVLRVTVPANFDGNSATVSVTATNPTGQSAQTSFTATAGTDTQVDPPFLGSVPNQTTPAGTPVTLTLTSTDLSGGGVAYTVVDATTFSTPANVTVSINQATGQVTLTPAAGFTGTISLLAGVRAASAADSRENYDTQAFTLTVNANPPAPSAPTNLDVDASSATGPFDGHGYITTATPKLTVAAETGATVQFKINGAVIATAIETTAGSGVYAATLPAGTLAVGANSITAAVADANGTSGDSSPMTLIYAPDYSGGRYVVPGTPSASQTLSIDWSEKNAAFNNEFGYFIADSADGSVGGVAPGNPGYAEAALGSLTRATLFTKGQKAGATTDVTLQGGQTIVFYLIQNNTTANFLALNPSNTVQGNGQRGAPLAFFSIEAANPDGMQHTQIIADSTTGTVQYNWEDLLSLGDSDFNDAAITVQPSGSSSAHAALHAPGIGMTAVTLSATLNSEKRSMPSGDLGVYFADDQNGTVGGLSPGDSGYAAAALAPGNFQVLFTAGIGGTQQASVPAGKYVAFYLLTSGTTSEFFSNNPTNSSAGAQALFSFEAANPDGVNHFRWYTPGQQATSPSAVELHVMDKLAGKISDFDAYKIDLSFTA